MSVSPLFELSWKKRITTFKSSSGLVIPVHLREALAEYIIHGVLPNEFLLGILTREFDRLFVAEKTPLEEARMQVIWEFVLKYFPINAWGSRYRVMHYSLSVKNGFMGRGQARFIQKQREKGINALEID